jgi:hypothetical protein
MIPLSLFTVDTNVTNMTSNLLRWSFEPYLTTLGQFAYPIFFLLLLGIMWTNTQSNKVLVPAVFMILLGFIGWQIFSTPVALFFQFIGISATAYILYAGFAKRGIE